MELACANIRFSSLFAAGDVSRGGTSATQRQKFHTDDLNLSEIWLEELIGRRSSYIVLAIVTNDRQKATKVKCKREESLTIQSMFVEYSLL